MLSVGMPVSGKPSGAALKRDERAVVEMLQVSVSPSGSVAGMKKCAAVWPQATLTIGKRLATGENWLVWLVLTRASTLKFLSLFPSISVLIRALPFQKTRRGRAALGMALNVKTLLPTN